MPNYSPDNRIRPGVSWATLVCEDGWPAGYKKEPNLEIIQKNELIKIIPLTKALPATRMELPALHTYTGEIYPDTPGVLLPEGIQAQQLAFGPPHLQRVTPDGQIRTYVRPEAVIGYDIKTGDVSPTGTQDLTALTGIHQTDLKPTTLFHAENMIDLATAAGDPREIENNKQHLPAGEIYPKLVKLQR